MSTLIATGASGWLLLAAITITIALPYLLRGRVLAVVGPRPLATRLWPHYWLGYAIAGLGLAHAWVPMAAGSALRANQAGLYLATAALLLIGVQVALGLMLREPVVRRRRTVRRWHFLTMVSLVALALGHIALNSAFAQGFLR